MLTQFFEVVIHSHPGDRNQNNTLSSAEASAQHYKNNTKITEKISRAPRSSLSALPSSLVTQRGLFHSDMGIPAFWAFPFRKA